MSPISEHLLQYNCHELWWLRFFIWGFQTLLNRDDKIVSHTRRSFPSGVFVQADRFVFIITWLSDFLLIHVVVVLLYVLRELGYTLICQVREKKMWFWKYSWKEIAKAQLEEKKGLVIQVLSNLTNSNWESTCDMDDHYTCRLDQTNIET